ncbi:MAG: hypothetical protein KC800_00815 [Candidatus Eremiobacteraeota bacterium]|nr:hypothetical protein [Candidatus Eremiobacteraeota bacterium]
MLRAVTRDGNEAVPAIRLEGEALNRSRPTLGEIRLPTTQPLMIRVEAFDSGKKMVRDFEKLVRLESGPNDLKIDLTPVENYRSAVFFQVPYVFLEDERWNSFGALRESLNAAGFLHQEDRLYFPPVPCRFWGLKFGDEAYSTDETGRIRLPLSALGRAEEATFSDPSNALRARVDEDDFGTGRCCERAFVLPYLFKPVGNSSLPVDEAHLAQPARSNTTLSKRGSYPGPFEGECRGIDRNYLDSPCFQRRNSGECSLEDLAPDYAALASYPNGIPVDFLGWSQQNFFSGPRFLNLVPTVSRTETVSCLSYHLGRDCTQTTPGDLSLETVSDSQIWFPGESFPVVQVRSGEVVRLVLHNNGSSGVSHLRVESSNIGGTLRYRYAEQAEDVGLLPSPPQEATSLRHGVWDTARYTYYPDVFLTYEAPVTAAPGQEDFLVFATDHVRLPVKFRMAY